MKIDWEKQTLKRENKGKGISSSMVNDRKDVIGEVLRKMKLQPWSFRDRYVVFVNLIMDGTLYAVDGTRVINGEKRRIRLIPYTDSMGNFTDSRRNVAYLFSQILREDTGKKTNLTIIDFNLKERHMKAREFLRKCPNIHSYTAINIAAIMNGITDFDFFYDNFGYPIAHPEFTAERIPIAKDGKGGGWLDGTE